jgi:hypothetical protein
MASTAERRVQDADGHVIEDTREIAKYLDEPHRSGPTMVQSIKHGYSLWPDLDGFSRPAVAAHRDAKLRPADRLAYWESSPRPVEEVAQRNWNHPDSPVSNCRPGSGSHS